MVLLGCCLLMGTALHAATILVTNTADTGTGSLRWAIGKAKTADIVRLDTSLLRSGSATIVLKSEILINKGLFIKGLYNRKDTVFISGGGKTKIFSIAMPSGMAFPDVDLDSLVFINGKSARGGAITIDNAFTNADGRVYFRRCLFRNNESAESGGAIAAHRGVTSSGLARIRIFLYHTSFVNNKAAVYGGAISTYAKTSSSSEPRIELTIVDCNFLGNESQDYGGAVYAFADCALASNSGKCILNIEGSTFSRNKSGSAGGAIYAFSNDSYTSQISLTEFQIKTSTFSHNQALSNGGAIYAECGDKCFVKAQLSTIAENTALLDGSAVYLKSRATQNSIHSLAELYLTGTLLVANGGNANYHNTFFASGYKAVMTTYSYNITDAPKTHFAKIQEYGSGTDTYGATKAQVKLGSLKINPRGTWTMIPDSGSIAINTGSIWYTEDAQNGPIKGIRDVGAAESPWCISQVYKQSASFCEGASYNFNGRSISTPGKYYDTLPRVAQCDSIIELTLNMNSLVMPSVTAVANPGSIIMEGVNVTFTPQAVHPGAAPLYRWRLNGTLMATGSSWASSSLKTGDKVDCVMTSNAACIQRSIDTSDAIEMRVHANNDEPCNGITLQVNPVCNVQTFANHGAGNTSSAGAHTCGSGATGDIWFRFVAPVSGQVFIQTFSGTMSDAIMSVYSGSCNAPVEIGCVDDIGLQQMPEGYANGLQHGNVYWIRISRMSGNNGHFGICLTDPNSNSTSGLTAIPFKVYPNPATRFVQLEMGLATHGVLRICDATGKVQREIRGRIPSILNTGEWSPGTYTIELETQRGKAVQRLLVQR